jgi:hypothetical protein
MEVRIERMWVLHVWFHNNANKFIRMWVFLRKSLGDFILYTLGLGITQCTF